MERIWLSQTIRIDKPTFFRLFTKWAKDNYWVPIIIAIGQAMVLFLFNQYVMQFEIFQLGTMIGIIGPYVMMMIYYWIKIWKLHVVITNWYGVFRETDYFDQLILSFAEMGSLVVFLKFGPAVHNWVSRLTVHNDCKLVNFRIQAHWKRGLNKEKGLICLSSPIIDIDPNLKYDLQSKIKRPLTPATKVTLEIMTNVDENKRPTNYQMCQEMTDKNGSHYFKKDFLVTLIPKE